MFVRNGEHVEIGKTIGQVGSTGLSPAASRIPHSAKGPYKNFENSPASFCPVSKKNLPEFAALREKWLPLLKNPELCSECRRCQRGRTR